MPLSLKQGSCTSIFPGKWLSAGIARLYAARLCHVFFGMVYPVTDSCPSSFLIAKVHGPSFVIRAWFAPCSFS